MNDPTPTRLTEADRGLARTLVSEGLLPSARLDEILALYQSSGQAETCATPAEFLVARRLVAADAIAPAAQAVVSLGRYRDFRVAGRGGMGIVYSATDSDLDRPVAIKVLPGPRPPGDPARERFLREARIAGQLDLRTRAVGPGE